MNNAHAIVSRVAGCCLRGSARPHSISTLARLLAVTPIHALADSAPRSGCTANFRVQRGLRSAFQSPFPGQSPRTRSFHATTIHHALSRSPKSKPEEGLAFRDSPLSYKELRDVFGRTVPSPRVANTLLRVLHARRIDGTIDKPLPSSLRSSLQEYPNAVTSALTWLRKEYFVDEDGAIFARFEREDAGLGEEHDPSKLMQRGQNLGLYAAQEKPKPAAYRPETTNQEPVTESVRQESVPQPTSQELEYFGPQSGQYRAPLSEKEGDVFGQSQFEKIKSENEVKFAAEEEALDKQIAEIQERRIEERTQDTALASRPEQSLEAADQEIRPPNELERYVLRNKNKATSQLTLESEEIKGRSTTSRLIPSLLFVVAGCAGLYVYADQWVAPKRLERFLPDMNLSFATVVGIISINVGVWVLWRIPAAWRMLNKYFLVVPATIQPLSLLGSMFSHTSFKHLAVNAVPLLVFGPSLHEDLGRGHFLALYISSGLVGAYLSLARFASQGILVTTSLGASGCTWGITAAFLNIHENDKFTIFFLPRELKDEYSIRGWMFFSALIAIEVLGVVTGRLQRRGVDYIAHFGGAFVGWSYAWLWKTREASSQGKTEVALKPTRPWWQLLNPGAAGASNTSKGT